jgi:hypothetical protein
MFHLINKQIIVFTNKSFIFQTKTESSLSKSNRTEFTSSWAHLTPLPHPLKNQKQKEWLVTTSSLTDFLQFLSREWHYHEGSLIFLATRGSTRTGQGRSRSLPKLKYKPKTYIAEEPISKMHFSIVVIQNNHKNTAECVASKKQHVGAVYYYNL